MKRWKSRFATIFNRHALPETNAEVIEVLKDMVRQGIADITRDTPLQHTPLNRLSERQALQAIKICRAKMAAHAKTKLLEFQAEELRARGMGVAVGR